MNLVQQAFAPHKAFGVFRVGIVVVRIQRLLALLYSSGILFCGTSLVNGQEQIVYTPYTFTTHAGKPGSIGLVDGAGSEARFTSPAGVALDPTGNLYVADTDNNAIRKVTPAGVVTTLAGPTPDPENDPRFSSPRGVVVDSEGNVIVADSNNMTIRKVSPAGVVTPLAGSPGVSGARDATGVEAQFYQPYDVALDSRGNIIVADSGNGMIRKVTSAGVVTTIAGQSGGLGLPVSVAVDSEDNIYFADNGRSTIRKISSQGAVSVLAGMADNPGFADGTGVEARFNLPYGIAVDGVGNVFVTDYGNRAIRKVTPTGVVTTLAGGPPEDWHDGTGSEVRFYFPWGIAVNDGGSLYVTDAATIRKGHPALYIRSADSGFGFKAGHFGFSFAGPMGQSVVIDSSPDLLSWTPMWTNNNPADLAFTDSQSITSSNRFYRARSQ